MKRTLFLILFLLTQMGVHYGQNIPDANFAAAIRSVCPTCINSSNNLLPPAQSLVNLNIASKNIASLTGLNGFTGLLYLTCSGNQLTSLPTIPSTVVNLGCNNNQLTSLPTLPPNLVALYCSNNQITSLPSLPNSITSLYCDANKLISLPTLPTSLETLICDNNQLTSLPSLPSGLTFLRCWSNLLTSLPTLPNSLTRLFCGFNSLTTLPTLPNSLQEMDCGTNQLTMLPTLPNSLTYFSCVWNKITSIPNIPTSIIDFNCYENLITTIPALPSGIKTLYCYSNKLATLPNVPTSLTILACGNNNLTTVPSSLYYTELSCEYNNIQCLPVLGSGLTRLWAPNSVTCLPNIPASLTNFRKYTGTYGSGSYTSTILPICTVGSCVDPCATDAVKPNFTNCPSSIVSNTLDTCARATWFTPTATDNCVAPTVTSNFQSGYCFRPGITTVIYTATDANNNSATCSFTITVINPCGPDVTKPSFTSCPLNIVFTTSDTCVRAFWSTPIARDNCGTPTVTSNFQSGNCFKRGINTVIYTATDANSNSATCSFTITVNSTIPVELMSFKAQNTEGGNLLIWQTATELNSSHYDIERSADGKNFEKIGETKAQGKAANYNYLDNSPLPIFSGSAISTTTYYRLKINDLDGKIDYSNTVSLSAKGQLNVKIYPNPTKDNVTIDLGEAPDATIRLVDILGKEMAFNKSQSGRILLDLSKVASGVYFVEIKANGQFVREKLLKN